ncbi:MAG: FHA domain-containing protein [Kiritimatiellaeota bacterium]|nr:FHA domain-containing protein [Kiritimatiellota bacterium]
MNQTRYYLLVEVGPAKGQRHFIPENGAKLGRSSQNDICIVDPQLSRQHCAFEFRGPQLWVRDLESANFTLVNDLQIRELPLRPGDRVHVGETVLRVVVEDAPLTNAAGIPGVTVVTPGPDAPAAPLITIPAPAEAAPTPAPAPAPQPQPHAPAAPVIDLGLAKAPDASAKKPGALRAAIYGLGAVLLLVVGVLLIVGDEEVVVTTPNEDNDQTLEFHYEKIEATPENISRSQFTITPDQLLAARINKVRENRSIAKEKRVAPADVESLAQRLKRLDFFTLSANYDAQNPLPNHLTEYNLTIVIGKQAHTARVRNRPEPPAFKEARELIETFGKNELNIWDYEDVPTEELVRRAGESLEKARAFVRDAPIDLGNLWQAVKHFTDADANLFSVDPKPEFYRDIIAELAEANEELEKTFNELRYSADHAKNTSNWEAAQRHLQDICRLIPDKNDPRHDAATRELIDVERRIRNR